MCPRFYSLVQNQTPEAWFFDNVKDEIGGSCSIKPLTILHVESQVLLDFQTSFLR